jgi:hypothetical protein
LPVEQLVDAERIKWIEAAMGTASEASMADIRQRLGDEVSYGQIKAVLNWHEWKKKQHATD